MGARELRLGSIACIAEAPHVSIYVGPECELGGPFSPFAFP